MLKALVGRQRVLGAIPTVTELANVQRVRLLVFVLEMAFQRVVTREGTPAVRTLLRLVDAAAGRWWHSELAAVANADAAAASTSTAAVR